jgi:hypothetical protein
MHLRLGAGSGGHRPLMRLWGRVRTSASRAPGGTTPPDPSPPIPTRPAATRVPLAGWLSMTPNPVVFAPRSSPALATFVSAAPPPLPPLGCAGTLLSFSSIAFVCCRSDRLRCFSRYLDRISKLCFRLV